LRKVRLTPAARRDLADIRRYTREIWGNAQMRRYMEGMGGHFSRIASGDAMLRSTAEGQADYRFTRYGSHFIFLLISEHAVSIIRVLHVRSDVVRHLGESQGGKAD